MALWWVGMLEFGVPIVLHCLEPMPALFWAVPSLKSYFQLAYLCSDRTLASLPACSRAFAEARTRHFVVTASQAQSGTISALWWKCHGHPSENVTKKYASWLCCCSIVQSSGVLTPIFTTGLGVDAAAHTAEHGHRTATQAISCSPVEEDLPVIRVGVDLGPNMTIALTWRTRRNAKQWKAMQSKRQSNLSLDTWPSLDTCFSFAEATLSLARLAEIQWNSGTCNFFKDLQRPSASAVVLIGRRSRGPRGQPAPISTLNKSEEKVLDNFLELALAP